MQFKMTYTNGDSRHITQEDNTTPQSTVEKLNRLALKCGYNNPLQC